MVRFSRVGLAVCLMGYPLWRWPLAWRSHREGNILKDQAYGERMGVSPRNSGECGFFSLGQGLGHGVGHSLLLLYDAKAPRGQKSKEFKGLGHYLSNTLYRIILYHNKIYYLY